MAVRSPRWAPASVMFVRTCTRSSRKVSLIIVGEWPPVTLSHPSFLPTRGSERASPVLGRCAQRWWAGLPGWVPQGRPHCVLPAGNRCAQQPSCKRRSEPGYKTRSPEAELGLAAGQVWWALRRRPPCPEVGVRGAEASLSCPLGLPARRKRVGSLLGRERVRVPSRAGAPLRTRELCTDPTPTHQLWFPGAWGSPGGGLSPGWDPCWTAYVGPEAA